VTCSLLTTQDDYIQWAIDHALVHWDPVELTSTVITKRFAALTFAAIQSSVITITHTLLDIASSPHSQDLLETMRDEVLSELSSPAQIKSHKGTFPSPWGKAALARMVHVDSAIRESMRLNGFVARGIMKTVMAPGGVTLPDGTHIPQGTKVGIQAYSVHHDEDHYPHAETYDAFRFVQETNADLDTAIASGSDTESLNGSCAPRKLSTGSASSGTRADRRPLAVVTTSPTFLAFSHGPNACPGRFFAANQMKLTLAHIALYYEIEPLPSRPENRWFVGSLGPPFEQMLRVKRRRV
jgi:cytochrome P450